MNDSHDAPRQLEITPPVWIALAVVAMIGVARWMSTRDPKPTEEIRPVIKRVSDDTHVFAALGIQVSPPEGWSCLTVEDDSAATEPTFVNETTNAILKFGSYLYKVWPPPDSEVVTRQYAGVTIQWVLLNNRLIGRFKDERADVTIMTVTSRNKLEVPESVEQFCDSIEFINPNQS